MKNFLLATVVASVLVVFDISLLFSAQEPESSPSKVAATSSIPCVPSVELVRAIAWPVSALIIAFVFRRPLAAFVGALGARVTKLSLFKVELELVPATAATSTPLLDDIKTATTSAPIGDSTRAMLEQVQTGTPADYATIDLGVGDEWLTSRLFIAAAMLERMRGLQVMVFVERTPATAQRFLAVVPVQTVRWALAQQYPHLEAAWASAYVQTFAGTAPLATFTSTGSGNLVGKFEWRIVPLVGNTRKTAQVQSATYTLNFATSGGHINWAADSDEAVTGYEIYRNTASGPTFYLEGTVSGRFATTFVVGGQDDNDTKIVKNPVLQGSSTSKVPQGAVWLPDTITSNPPVITSNSGGMNPYTARQIVSRFIDSLQRPMTTPRQRDGSGFVPNCTEPPAGWTQIGEREEHAELVGSQLLRVLLPQDAFSAWSDAFDDAPKAKRTRAILRRATPFVALTRGDREFVRLVNRKTFVEEVIAPLAEEPEPSL